MARRGVRKSSKRTAAARKRTSRKRAGARKTAARKRTGARKAARAAGRKSRARGARRKPAPRKRTSARRKPTASRPAAPIGASSGAGTMSGGRPDIEMSVPGEETFAGAENREGPGPDEEMP